MSICLGGESFQLLCITSVLGREVLNTREHAWAGNVRAANSKRRKARSGAEKKIRQKKPVTLYWIVTLIKRHVCDCPTKT